MPASRGGGTHVHVACYHEAGHAVAALFEQRQVGLVEVDYKKPGNGRVGYSRPPLAYALNPHHSRGTALAAWEMGLAMGLSDIRILLAGPLAEAKALGQPLRALGAYSDLDRCRSIADALLERRQRLGKLAEIPETDQYQLLEPQRRYVRRWVGRPRAWYMITRLAERLRRYPVATRQTIAEELSLLAQTPGQHSLELGPPEPTTRKGETDHRRRVFSPMNSPPILKRQDSPLYPRLRSDYLQGPFGTSKGFQSD